jgi:hypothetical protein
MTDKIAIIIDTSISMTYDPGHGITWTHGPPHRGDFLKDWPMGALAIDIGKRIADDRGTIVQPHSVPTTVDIFAFGVGRGWPPVQYKSFDEIHAPNGGTPMTECLEYLIDQDYDKIYAISDGLSNSGATGPWPDSVATIFVIPTIEEASNILERMVHSDPHTAATIIAAFIL